VQIITVERDQTGTGSPATGAIECPPRARREGRTPATLTQATTAPTLPPPITLSPKGDIFFDRSFGRIDPKIAASFTDQQFGAIKAAFTRRPGLDHLVEFRHGLALGRKRYYFALLFGSDKRLFKPLGKSGHLTELAHWLPLLSLSGGLLAAFFAIAWLIRT